MHPDFVRELSNQYQFEARERAARWRLGKLLRRRRQETPATTESTTPPAGVPTSASGGDPVRGAEVPANDEVAAESPTGSTDSAAVAHTEERASLRDTPNLVCT